ncbi:MAG: HD domain-containing protein [Acidobacteriota bacterium]|nr:HD domain-containing protein [Acidobacteriota bacterium]
MRPPLLRLSTILSALSYALDLTEGHPRGHSARSCLIGMRLAEVLGLPPAERSDLFYALLMKDAGCSSNAARVYQLFGGDDRIAKHALWLRDWRKVREQAAYVLECVEPQGRVIDRLKKLAGLALAGSANRRQVFEVRCDRGADIAHAMGFTPATAAAIRSMDEHWDGGGLPAGLRGEAIPLLARIVGIAQVAEIFGSQGGPDAASRVVRERRGTWFAPELVSAFAEVQRDTALWAWFGPEAADRADLDEAVGGVEPQDRVIAGDDARLDAIAAAFAWVIDAKSPYTYQHSERVAEAAVAIGSALGLDGAAVRELRWAALLHDIGKLSVPNRILDKAGTLTADEWEVIRLHPYYTYRILERVPVFGALAFDASAHHERMDGRGYYRNLTADGLSRRARILAVADVFDALAADRPYRKGMPPERVGAILREESGPGLCPDCVGAALDVSDALWARRLDA